MANYFSISDGNLTDAGVFGESIPSADVFGDLTRTGSKLLTTVYISSVPFFIETPVTSPIYGIAFHIDTRSNTPTGTLDVQLVGPTGILLTESYDISLFTEFDGHNNFLSPNPMNWQLLKFSSPIPSLPAGEYRVNVKTTTDNQLTLVGDDAGIDVVNYEPLSLTGALNLNSPFIFSPEQSANGTLSTKPGAATNRYSLGPRNFTLEGYFFFNTFAAPGIDWNPLICLGDGWDGAAWGLAYNSTTKEVHFWNSNLLFPSRFSTKVDLPINSWLHIVINRAGEDLTLWVNGVCVGLWQFNTVDYTTNTDPALQICRFIKDFVPFVTDAAVSNIKITKGRCKYISDVVIVNTPLSVRPDTALLYADPYIDYYLTTDSRGTITQKPIAADAIVLNHVDQLRYTRISTSTTPLTTNNPFGLSPEFSLHLNGSVRYTDPVSHGDIAASDFTIESWIYLDSNNLTQRVCTYSSGMTTPSDYVFGLDTTLTTLHGFVGSAGGIQDVFQTTGSVSRNIWHHVAMVKAGTTLKLYLDGLLVGSAPVAATINTPTSPTMVIGGERDGTVAFNGAISNLRLVIGRAIYNTNFNTTSPADGADIISPVPLEIVDQPGVYSTAVLLRVKSPLDFDPNPSIDTDVEDCMIFNGQSFIQIPDIEDKYNVGDSNEPFTIELWMYALSNNTTQCIISKGGGLAGFASFGTGYELILNNKSLDWVASTGDKVSITLSHANFGVNFMRQWTHVAITYDGTATRMHINGRVVATAATPHAYDYTKDKWHVFKIGDSHTVHNVKSSKIYFGYLSNIRIVKGTCLYSTANFIPDRTLRSIANTTLLMQSPYEELEFKFQTSPFQPSRIERLPFLDGIKNVTTVHPIPSLAGEFTIETWFYCLRGTYFGTSVAESILECRASGTSTTPFVVTLNETPGKITVFVDSTTTIVAGNVVPRRWTHFAMVRKNNNVNLYQDGIHIASFFSDKVWGANPLIIGQRFAGGGKGTNNFFGYLSNVRIVASALYGQIFPAPSFSNPLTIEPDTTFLLKVGTNFDKALITTNTPAITSSFPEEIMRDAITYTPIISGCPWDINYRDFMVFDAGNSIIQFIDNPLFDLYDAPFTLEFWVYRTANIGCQNRAQTLFNFYADAFYINCANKLQFNGISTNITIPFQEWAHVAIVQDPAAYGEKMLVYYNGELSHTFTGRGQMMSNSPVNHLIIGNSGDQGVGWDPSFRGYMSNIRLAKGFVSTYIHDNSNRHIFNNTTAKVYAINDSPAPGVANSAYFSGLPEAYLLSVNRADMLEREFTIEFYIKIDLSVASAHQAIIHSVDGWLVETSINGNITFIGKTYNPGYISDSNPGTPEPAVSTISVTTPAGVLESNVWVHVAIVRTSASDINIYVDKVLVVSENNPGQISNPGLKTLYIAPNTKCAIGGIKINNSHCQYTSNIISPSYPFAIDPDGTTLLLEASLTPQAYTPPYVSNFIPSRAPLTRINGTVLLLQNPHNFHNKTAYTGFNTTIEPAANPNTGSSAYKFNGDWENFIQLYADHRLMFNSNTKFCIEAWVKPKDISTNTWTYPHGGIFDKYIRCIFNKPGTLKITLIRDNKLQITTNTGSVISDISLADDVWAHIACVCDGRKIFLFVDGILQHTVKFTAPSTENTQAYIGASTLIYNAGGIYWHCADFPFCLRSFIAAETFYGLITDVRVVKDNQVYNTTINIQGPDYPIETGTLFLYQPVYDVFNYLTESGIDSMVINTTIPDDTIGIPFDGEETYIKTKPLIGCAADLLFEIWFESTRTSPVFEVLVDGRENANDIPWSIALNESGTHTISLYCGGTTWIRSDNNVYAPNTFTHVAVIRSGPVVSLYVDGEIIGSAKNTEIWSAHALYIGSTWDQNSWFKGIVYSARLIKDHTVYNVTFNPVTHTPVPEINSTSLLITEPLYNGTNTTQPETGDLLKLGYLHYPNRNTNSLSAVSPINSTDNILYFNYNQYIQLPDQRNNFKIANSPWTFEAFVYISPDITYHRKTIFYKGFLDPNRVMDVELVLTSNNFVTFGANTVNLVNNVEVFTTRFETNNTRLTPYTWTHILVSSDGAMTELYIDGKFNHRYNFAPQVDSAPSTFFIGFNQAGEEYFTGAMSNVRLIRGERTVTTTINVPTEAFTDNPLDDPLFSDVGLLLHADGPDNSTLISDSSFFSRAISVHGDVKIRTVTNKFGGSSLFFSSPADFLTGGINAGKFGVADFTIEFWVFAESAPNNDQTIISCNIHPNSSGISIKYRSNTLEVWSGNTQLLKFIGWSLDRWHYVAVTRESDALCLFVDGILIETTIFNANCTDGLQFIGKGLVGFLDELRITNGVARYGLTFTPPTTPLQIEYGTSALITGNYTKFKYGVYPLDGIHISSDILGSTITPRLIELSADARVNNLYIHNKGTLHVPVGLRAALNVYGANGIQITSGGSLNIN